MTAVTVIVQKYPHFSELINKFTYIYREDSLSGVMLSHLSNALRDFLSNENTDDQKKEVAQLLAPIISRIADSCNGYYADIENFIKAIGNDEILRARLPTAIAGAVKHTRHPYNLAMILEVIKDDAFLTSEITPESVAKVFRRKAGLVSYPLERDYKIMLLKAVQGNKKLSSALTAQDIVDVVRDLREFIEEPYDNTRRIEEAAAIIAFVKDNPILSAGLTSRDVAQAIQSCILKNHFSLAATLVQATTNRPEWNDQGLASMIMLAFLKNSGDPYYNRPPDVRQALELLNPHVPGGM